MYAHLKLLSYLQLTHLKCWYLTTWISLSTCHGHCYHHCKREKQTTNSHSFSVRITQLLYPDLWPLTIPCTCHAFAHCSPKHNFNSFLSLPIQLSNSVFSQFCCIMLQPKKKAIYISSVYLNNRIASAPYISTHEEKLPQYKFFCLKFWSHSIPHFKVDWCGEKVSQKHYRAWKGRRGKKPE